MTLSEADFEYLAQLEVLKFEYGRHCVMMLNRLVEELPLERWIGEAVESGELAPSILTDLFGSGEGGGWPEAQGMNIETALGSWYGCERMIVDLIERNRTEDGYDD